MASLSSLLLDSCHCSGSAAEDAANVLATRTLARPRCCCCCCCAATRKVRRSRRARLIADDSRALSFLPLILTAGCAGRLLSLFFFFCLQEARPFLFLPPFL